MQHQRTLIPTTFEADGYALVPATVSVTQLDALAAAIETFRSTSASPTAAGLRNLLSRCPAVRAFATSAPALPIAHTTLGDTPRPIRAILFDKTPASNWYVTWHQDLTIPVTHKADAPGFGPWSTKDGITHVQPPAAVLARMIALRIHIDACPEDNGAIKFIPGTHAFGILDPARISDWKSAHPAVSCPAARGDVIIMRPLILHSSSISDTPDHRRVLHIEYASGNLPCGLEWAQA